MAADAGAARPRGILVGVAAAGSVLGLAVAGAVVTADPASGLNTVIEGLSSGSSGVLANLGLLLPLGFAFAAGMVAAVNPCGFVLLPTYLGVFVAERDGDEGSSAWRRLQRSVVVGSSLTAGFVLLFAVIGLLIGSVATVIVNILPWLGFAVGVGLVLLGGYRLAGGALYTALPDRLSARLSGGFSGGLSGGAGRAPKPGGYFLFGIAYGTASLSCTLPIFLAVLGGSLAASDLAPALGRLVLYGLGMGTVIMVATLAVGLLKGATLRRLRGASRWVEPLGTAFLFVAGGYIVYYWLTVGGLFRS
ncbi:MAG: cytochrome c biogenesis protein CcdA [Chloroflexota bacterium]